MRHLRAIARKLWLAAKGRAPDDHFEEDASHGPIVDLLGVDAFTHDQLGGSIPEGAQLAVDEHDCVSFLVRQPKVADFDRIIIKDQYVRGFQILVHESRRVYECDT